MSQSDYIRHKKMANILKHQENLGNVLNSQDLTSFRTFELSKTIYDDSLTYNEILPGNKVNCPSFLFCTGTNTRPNRSKRSIPMFSHYRGKISKNGYFWEQKTKNKLCLEKEFKECDSYLYRRKIWFKRID